MEQIDFLDLLSDLSLEEVFEAYFECRQRKRRTLSSLRFENDYEHNLIVLWEEIKSRTYQITKSNAFLIEKPVMREVFAANFKDRIVHHLIMRRFMSLFEQAFIDNSYSCRPGKGTLYGIRSVNEMIKKSSQNYTRDCFVLRLDIQGFFFHINRTILHQKIKELIDRQYRYSNKSTMMYLLEKILTDNPTQHCHIKGSKEKWAMLPISKSLFHSPKNSGLPIGNLTSQIFANYYLNDFDHFITSYDKDLYYGRYVDDIVLIHHDMDFLKSVKDVVQDYLKKNLKLNLHPKKVVLQHYAKGFAFVGAYVKPGRIYPGKRLKASYFKKIMELNALWEKQPMNRLNRPLIKQTLASLNSYYGLLRHYNAYRLKLKGWNMLHPNIREVFEADPDFMKVSIYPEYQKKIFAATRRYLCPPTERRANKFGSDQSKPNNEKSKQKKLLKA